MLIFLLSSKATSEEPAPKKVHVTLVLMGQSQSLLRGAQTWEGPSMMVGPALSFYERLHIRGPNVLYSLVGRFRSKLHLSVGARYIDDDKPLIKLDSTKESYRNERSGATEVLTHLHLAPWGNHLLRWELEYAKEVHRHKGSYGFTSFSLPTFFIPFTSVKIGAGFGDKKHSEWLYGRGASGGLLHSEIGLENNLVRLPWSGIIHNSLVFHHIDKEVNKSSYYIRDESSHLVYNLRVMWFF